ncbi:unnamed protein product, partial [Mesorhabditis spiculigera]
MGAVDEFNSLAFERLELAATYTDLSLQLEKLLEEVRSETSRARSINGLTLTAAAGLGATDLEPYTRVNVSGDDFWLQDLEASEEGDSKVRKRTSTKGNSDEEPKEKADEKKQGLPQGAFRPFGILEPNSAKLRIVLYTPDKRPVHQIVLQRGEEFRHQLSFNGLYVYFRQVQETEKQLSIVFAEAQGEALLTFTAWVSLPRVGRVHVKYKKWGRRAHS